MGKMIEEFNAYRTKMNDRIMETAPAKIRAKKLPIKQK